jgi:pimeloyl-ACP methyl ester carboxylesterase
MTPSRSDFLTVRGLRTHVRHWGREGAPKIFMLHGWMDVAASFQFVVDHLHGDWHVIAPDWRGFGLTERAGTDTYWFPDYLADLDAILCHYQPEGQVNLVGHSMGGNIAGIYAGVRPERIRRFVNLEGFGLTGAKPDDAPGRYAKWLDELLDPPVMKGYPTQQAGAARLQKTNPRLTDERAAFLAHHWSAQNAAGKWEILGDPVHKQASPLPYHAEDGAGCRPHAAPRPAGATGGHDRAVPRVRPSNVHAVSYVRPSNVHAVHRVIACTGRAVPGAGPRTSSRTSMAVRGAAARAAVQWQFATVPLCPC